MISARRYKISFRVFNSSELSKRVRYVIEYERKNFKSSPCIILFIIKTTVIIKFQAIFRIIFKDIRGFS